jgi:hypothetical protein
VGSVVCAGLLRRLFFLALSSALQINSTAHSYQVPHTHARMSPLLVIIQDRHLSTRSRCLTQHDSIVLTVVAALCRHTPTTAHPHSRGTKGCQPNGVLVTNGPRRPVTPRLWHKLSSKKHVQDTETQQTHKNKLGTTGTECLHAWGTNRRTPQGGRIRDRTGGDNQPHAGSAMGEISVYAVRALHTRRHRGCCHGVPPVMCFAA